MIAFGQPLPPVSTHGSHRRHRIGGGDRHLRGFGDSFLQRQRRAAGEDILNELPVVPRYGKLQQAGQQSQRRHLSFRSMALPAHAILDDGGPTSPPRQSQGRRFQRFDVRTPIGWNHRDKEARRSHLPGCPVVCDSAATTGGINSVKVTVVVSRGLHGDALRQDQCQLRDVDEFRRDGMDGAQANTARGEGPSVTREEFNGVHVASHDGEGDGGEADDIEQRAHVFAPL